MKRLLLVCALCVTGCIPIAKPSPKPPNPPNPPNPVDPPTPKPTVGKIAVLIITPELSDKSISNEQSSAIYGGEVRAYLDQHCDKDPDGKTPQRRWLSKKTDISSETPFWQEGFNKFKDVEAPYIVITNGTTGTEGPYPANIQDTLNLLKKWGGP